MSEKDKVLKIWPMYAKFACVATFFRTRVVPRPDITTL